MAQKTSGQLHRQDMTVIQLLPMFPDDTDAEKWFDVQHCPEGCSCPPYGSAIIHEEWGRKSMPYRCRGCAGHFSVKRSGVMQSSKVGLPKWAIARNLVPQASETLRI